MTIKVAFPKEWLDLEQELFDIKSKIVYRDVPAILSKEQARGFPRKESEYQLFLKNRGSTTRRSLSTIRPKYLRIPFSFRFVQFGEDMAVVAEAALFAWKMARARAPVRTSEYRRSIILDSTGRSPYAPPETIDPKTVFGIGSGLIWANTVEMGFYTGYYKTRSRPGGIFYFTAQQTKKKYGDQISLSYSSSEILIAAPGRLVDKLARPGRSRRSRMRQRIRGR